MALEKSGTDASDVGASHPSPARLLETDLAKEIEFLAARAPWGQRQQMSTSRPWA